MDGGVMGEVIYEDTDQRITRDEDGVEHVEWLNPQATGARLAAIEAWIGLQDNGFQPGVVA